MSDVSKQRLLLATRNPHKTREVREILGDAWEVCDMSDFPDVPDVEETGDTFEENARIKALGASGIFDGWVLADDSGLEVDALGGAPGVRSARFAGDSAGMEENRALLLEKMKSLRGDERRGRFRCVLALAKDGAVVRTFSGAVEGLISTGERGAAGFGYDPMFIPDGHERTFAEMTASEKNVLSHRGRALALMAEFLRRA